MNITEPLEGETKYSPKYIYRQIFGTKMRGHHQSWPDIHLDELRQINPDTVGWIRMENSPVNYPVVKQRPQSPYHYFSHNFSGEPTVHGAVTMGCGEKAVLRERSTVIGAHHMKDCSMFFSVSQLFSPEYYETHRGFSLLLEDGVHQADFFAVHYMNSRDPEPVRTVFSSEEDYALWLAEQRRQSLYEIPVSPGTDDKVLILITCVHPEDPDDWRNMIAAYAVLRPVEVDS